MKMIFNKKGDHNMDGINDVVQGRNHDDNSELSELLTQLEIRQVKRKQQMLDKVKRITSLEEANDLFDSAPSEVQEILFQRIISGQISGDADDYHNASICFSKLLQYNKAADICRKGIELWPNDIDLNADLLSYLIDTGNIEDANKQAEQLELNCPDRSKWNWRGFRFLFKYLMNAHPNGYEKKTEDLVEDYKKVLPWDEKAYRCAADLYESKGEINRAISVLEDGISKLSAPQCALHLADLYFERANYDDAIRVSTLGIAFAAEPQPSIRTAYLLFLRALSKDARYLKSGKISPEEGKAIISEYELAMKYGTPREKEVIKQRIDILRVYSGDSLPAPSDS